MNKPNTNKYFVFDDRTNERMFEGRDGMSCAIWIANNISEDDEAFEHVWVETVEREESDNG